MYDFVIDSYEIEADIVPDVAKEVAECVRYVSKRFHEMWLKHNRTASKVLAAHTGFMDETFQLPLHVLVKLPTSSRKNSQQNARGPKTLSFKDSSEVIKRRKTLDLRTTHDTEELLYATQMKLTNTRQKNVAKSLLQEVTAGSSDVAKRVKPTDPIVEYSALDAVALIVDLSLSKYDYNQLRTQAKKRNCNLYPSYEKVLAAKKTCYPPESSLQVGETVAEIQLQALLDHTAKRILEGSSLNNFSDSELLNVTLTVKWGCDGSNGHSEYKQKFIDDENGTQTDANLFLTSIAPVRADAGARILFQNPTPSSTRYCRPVRIQLVRETTEVTLSEKANMDIQIQNLRPAELEINGRLIRVHYRLYMTMVDGKVVNAVTNTKSAQRCNICKATPTQMNNLQNVLLRPIDEEAFQFGLSVLHAKIRFFEYFLHLGYKMEVKKWRCTGPDSEIVKDRKQVIQQRFRQELGLIVDMPRGNGAGSSNDGNTARRFFENASVAAEILDVDLQVIKRCSTILQVISSSQEINATKFKNYCLDTARLLVSSYPWFYLPATVHKILMHGSDIILHFDVPIGQLSEEAQESLNKVIKRFRLDHTRKTSRAATNGDLINRLLVSSDPLIAGLRVKLQKKDKEFSEDAKFLLDFSDSEDETDEE